MTHTVTWLVRGGAATQPPNPEFPEGVTVDFRSFRNAEACKVDLQYPAPCIGIHEIVCNKCKIRVMVTAAGRVDDPKTAIVPCRIQNRGFKDLSRVNGE